MGFWWGDIIEKKIEMEGYEYIWKEGFRKRKRDYMREKGY